MNKRTWFLFILFFFISFTLIWSIQRKTSIKVRVNKENYDVYFNNKIINSAKNTDPTLEIREKINLKIIHDRDSLFIPFLINRQRIKILDLDESLLEFHYLNTKPSKNLINSLFDYKNPLFSGDISYSDEGYLTEITSDNSYQNFELEVEVANPAEININQGEFRFWSRPLWRHENIIRIGEKQAAGVEIGRDLLTLIKLSLSKISINIISSIFILIILSLIALVFNLLFKKTRVFIYHKYYSKKFFFVALIFSSIVFSLFSYITSVNILEKLPHSQDEVSYIFQSRVFSSGIMFLESLPEGVRRFFDNEFIVNNGYWFSMYTPGTSVFLALGNLINIPYLINPLFGLLSLILIYLLTKHLFSSKEALLSALFFSISPFTILVSSSFLSHAPALFFTLLFIYSIFKKNYLITGLALGFLFINRPYNAILMFISLFGIVIINHISKKINLISKQEVANLVKIAIGFTPLLLFQLFYNQVLTGSFLKFPLTIYSPYNRPGFGEVGIEWPINFTPIDALGNLVFNFYSLLDMIFGWPFFISLAFVPLAFLGRKSYKRNSFILLMIFFIQVIGYSFFHGRGTFYGPRYLYEVSFILFILSARGITNLFHLLKRATNQNSAFLTILFAVSCLFLYSILRNVYNLPKFRGYNGISKTEILQNIKKPALVFVEGKNSWQEYAGYFNLQSPLLKDEVIFARDKAVHNVPKDLPPLDNKILIKYFPNRNVYQLVDNKIRKIDF